MIEKESIKKNRENSKQRDRARQPNKQTNIERTGNSSRLWQKAVVVCLEQELSYGQ